jgi:hypothetical protein
MEEDSNNLTVTLLGGNMEGSVSYLVLYVGICAILQEGYYIVDFISTR